MTTTNTASRETYTTALRYVLDMMNVPALRETLESADFEMGRFDEVREKLIALRNSQEKKSSSERKPSAKIVALNDNIASLVMETLANASTPMAMAEMLDANAKLHEVAKSVQKLSGVMRTLVKEGKVKKSSDKKRSYFELA